MKKIFYILFIFTVLVSCSDNTPKKSNKNSTEKELILKSQNPEKTYIQLYNCGETDVKYRIKLNGNIFYDFTEIIDTIKNQKSDKPDYYKAWQFVKDNTEHITFFSKENWLYSPVILINSIGFANCGMRAAALCNIWVKLGYTARVWHLEGHVVPEIFINKRWEMYDPDMEVYYFNNDKKVAGVEELVINPALITNPINKFKSTGIIYADTSRYSKTTATYYSTVNNNFLFNWKVDNNDLLLKLDFTLPPKSSFAFPEKFENKLFSTNNNEIKNYSNAKLAIPPGWVGIIEIPLVIHAIHGQGSVTINDKTYNIGSEELNDLINSRKIFIHSIKINSTQSTIEIIYLVNNKIFKLEKNNSLVLMGQNIDKLQVNLFQLK